MRTLLALLATLAVGILSCGGLTRPVARAAAVQHTCNRYEQCGYIGEGKYYADRDRCEVQWTTLWDGQWADEACDKYLDAKALDVCFAAIDTAACSGADALNVYYAKCPASDICKKPQ